MAISRERAVVLSHEILDRLVKTQGVSLKNEREFVRNRVLQALLDWNKEEERLATDVRREIAARGRKAVEGSREWDLLYAEAMERQLGKLASQGE